MKTKIFFLLATLLLTSMCAFAQSGNKGSLKGDVNEDGVVDVADINAVIQIMKKGGGIAKETAYYWYVGATAPTALPTDDSNLATGTNPGWRKISDSKPSVGTQIFSDDDEIIVSTTKVPIYIAVNSDINLRFEDSLENEFEDFVSEPTITNDIKIYTTLFRAKSFNGNVKIK